MTAMLAKTQVARPHQSWMIHVRHAFSRVTNRTGVDRHRRRRRGRSDLRSNTRRSAPFWLPRARRASPRSSGDDPERTGQSPGSLCEGASCRRGPRLTSRSSHVVGFVDTPGRELNLPLDVRGTAFQRRVWQKLQEIPIGKKVTYAEVAGRIGLPKAVRAVAGACAANNLAVAIPCHRVVRARRFALGVCLGH